MPRSAWWYAFDILYLLPNYFFKMASSVLGPPHLALLWTGQNFSNTPGLLLTGCFLSVCDRLCCCIARIFLYYYFLNDQFDHLWTIAWLTLSGNVHVEQVPLYLCSRYSVNYWRAKGSMGTNNSRLGHPLLPFYEHATCGGERYTIFVSYFKQKW